MTYDARFGGMDRHIDLYNNVSRKWTTATRPSATEIDPNPAGFNTTLGEFEYWNGTSWTQLGGGGGGGGLTEPGLIYYNDPAFLVEFSYGFDAGNPAFLCTSRNLYVTEEIRLLVTEFDAFGELQLIPQPADIIITIQSNDTYTHVYYFTPSNSLASVGGFIDGYIMATIGIYDTSTASWVDKISVMINNAPA